MAREGRYPAAVDPASTTRPVCRLGLRIGPLAVGPGPSLLDRATRIVRVAEEVGFDSLWVADGAGLAGHPGTETEPEPAYEAYSLLGALATRTRSLRLGVLPEGGDVRLPAVMAKMVTTVDILSGGRGCLTLGTTGPDGVEAGDVDDVGQALAERLQVCRTVLEDEAPAFDGGTYAVHGAHNRPGPVQRGGVPIVVAARSPVSDRILHAAADHADALILDGGVSDVARVWGALSSHPPLPGRRAFEILWTGTLTDRAVTPSGLVGQVASELEAGATGCIVDLATADAAGAVARYGPLLRQMVDSVLGPGVGASD